MATREEIKEAITEIVASALSDNDVGPRTDEILQCLHSQGVVIKVDSKGHESPECDWCYWNTHKVEPLMEEKDDKL